jgi:hypothetical protein
MSVLRRFCCKSQLLANIMTLPDWDAYEAAVDDAIATCDGDSTPMPDEPFASILQRWTMLPSVRPAR